jgi:hypothetical protein
MEQRAEEMTEAIAAEFHRVHAALSQHLRQTAKEEFPS